ncbi:MAG TPA: AAA family ATPase, partial [Solirubrobacteraceae bacterium]|nr:AAA family ATPase [Solirubrobacteraceae bacterium]
MTLLGRDDECAALDRLLADVRQCRSRSLILRGEAGIGKTALLTHIVDSASDLTVARAGGVESEMELAFAGLHQLCAPMLDRLPRLPAPQRRALAVVFGLNVGAAPDRFLVGLAVLSLLSTVADERPLLCVVDDAHWLDQASAQALAFVARRLLAEPVGIVFAARERTEELQHLSELEVRGLRTADARALLGSALRFRLDERIRDRVVAETGGNPLALLELPRSLTATELEGRFGMLGAQDLSGHLEETFVRRLDEISDDARRLLLLAAAEPIGDALLLWRAAERLGIAPEAADEAEAHGLLAVDERVRFRHPLVRSAAYRSAPVRERRTVHLALAETTDRETDPDRRAWHLAAAAAGPDEQVALELERSAGRARARGGRAAAAAFLKRAVALTQDPARRAERSLAAAQASVQVADFEGALSLLATAHAEPLDELQRARVDLLRAEIAFASNRGSTAPALLLRAAARIEPLDARLARAGYVEAMSAALFAARMAGPDGGVRHVADAVRARTASGPGTPADALLDGWATLFAAGCAAATPTLREALTRFRDVTAGEEELQLLWLVTITAPVVWDDAQWDALSTLHVDLARSSGALSELPLALNSRTYVHLFRGELETAEALIDEARIATDATRAGLTPWGAVALEVLRGREQEAATVLEAGAADATRRGEGIGLTVVNWARALLYNTLGMPDRALAAARAAVDCPTNSGAASWGMVELIEAAARLGEGQAAAEAAGRFADIARAAETDWALGVDARSRALLSTGAGAEELYREALERLGRCRMRLDAARAQLLYGEWLRRERRRVDARVQLRAAHDQFAAMGMDGFAERARKELLATGAKARKRTLDTRDDL